MLDFFCNLRLFVNINLYCFDICKQVSFEIDTVSLQLTYIYS